MHRKHLLTATVELSSAGRVALGL